MPRAYKEFRSDSGTWHPIPDTRYLTPTTLIPVQKTQLILELRGKGTELQKRRYSSLKAELVVATSRVLVPVQFGATSCVPLNYRTEER